ncbi:P-loop containing nucleoside triphosphate hydrolase [Trinorchestia longiramus]|nr:P-loop containing nucleoside triphosphate hydrolase [Trinorchestia longiramus]
MSRIQRLEVRGIRSFGPDNPQQIRFTPPLTLILGQNGCGKTTIIEALKYITTGEVPPGCGRGGPFVHDPKISREMAVRGQIKLRIITATRERVDLVRSMEVVQKARSLEFKSLDQTITRTSPDGTKRHISSKCADFLWETLDVIGVSKPILENVIFCHQEESNWPLDESKKVKDKFDAIFNATRYIKCLEAMRKLRMEKKLQVKNMTETLASLRDLKEEADRKRADLVTQQELVEQIKLEQEEVNEKKAPILKRIEEINECERSIAKISQDLGSKENRIAMLKENNDTAGAEQTHSIECSDEELQRKILEYQTTLSLKKNQIHKAERSIGEVNQDLKLLSTKQSEEQKRLTKLETEQEQHQARVQRRNQKIAQLVTDGVVPTLQVYGSNGGYTESEAESCVRCIAEHVVQLQDQLETRNSDMLATEEALQTSINALRSREAALDQEVRGLDGRIARLEQQKRLFSTELRKLEREMQLCDTEALKAQIADHDQKLLCKEQSFDETQALKRLEELKQRRGELSRQASQVKAQLVEMNKMAADRSELDVHNKEVQDMSKKITQLFHQCKGVLERILPSTVTEESLKADYDTCYKNLQKNVSTNKTMLDSLKEKRSKHQVTVDSLRKQQIEKEKEIKSLEERISDVCPDMPLEEALHRKKEQLEALLRESGELESTQTVMERYVEKLTVEDCCPLCHRDFAVKDDNLALRDELRGRLSNLPLRLKNAKSRLLSAEKQYNALLQLEPFKEQLQDAQAKLRNIQGDLSRPVSELTRINEELDDCEANLSLYESEATMCQSVQEAIVAASTMLKSRSKLISKCAEIKSRLGDQGIIIS